MSCITPITLKRPYRTMKGELTSVVPCGKCPMCLKRRAKEWSFRLKEELKVATSAAFLTLTYQSPPLSFNGEATLRKKHVQDFLKRLRKARPVDGIRYYACGEYGTRFQRPHYHMILYNLNLQKLKHPTWLLEKWLAGNQDESVKGFIHIGNVQMASIHYVTGYMQKGKFEPQHELDDRDPEFSLMSKNLGSCHLGELVEAPSPVNPSRSRGYINLHMDKKKYYIDDERLFCRMPGGYVIPLPRYYRDKLFSRVQRTEISEKEEPRLKRFQTPEAEVDWKKFQIRKHEMDLELLRQKF